MRKVLLLVLVITAAFLMYGCGGPKAVTDNCIPEWVDNPPSDPGYMFAIGAGESKILSTAQSKATTRGRAELSRQISAYVKTLQKDFTEEVGAVEDAEVNDFFSQATKVVSAETLHGSRVAKRKTCKEGMINTVYVLMELPIGAAAEEFMQELDKNRKMYERFRATQAFNELEDEVEKYKEEQNN